MLERCVDSRPSKNSHLLQEERFTIWDKSQLLKAAPVRPYFQWQEGAGLARRQGRSACRGTRAAGSSRGLGGAGAATRGCPPQDGRRGNLLSLDFILWLQYCGEVVGIKTTILVMCLTGRLDQWCEPWGGRRGGWNKQKKLKLKKQKRMVKTEQSEI